MKKVGWKRSVKIFSVDYNPVDTNDILDIRKYLMKGKVHKIMFRIIKKCL